MASCPSDGVNSTTQLGVICQLAEGALDLSVDVVNEDLKDIKLYYIILRYY